MRPRKLPKCGKNNTILGPFRRSRSFKVTDFSTNRKLIYGFLSVISTNLPPILHCVGDTAFEMWKNRYIWLSLLRLKRRRRGSPGTFSVKYSVDDNGWSSRQGTLWRRKIAENFNQCMTTFCHKICAIYDCQLQNDDIPLTFKIGKDPKYRFWRKFNFARA